MKKGKSTTCAKCEKETTTKRVTTKLVIDEESKSHVMVSARMQICNACGFKGYSDKELGRLRELCSFYARELLMREEEPEEPEEALEEVEVAVTA